MFFAAMGNLLRFGVRPSSDPQKAVLKAWTPRQEERGLVERAPGHLRRVSGGMVKFYTVEEGRPVERDTEEQANLQPQPEGFIDAQEGVVLRSDEIIPAVCSTCNRVDCGCAGEARFLGPVLPSVWAAWRDHTMLTGPYSSPGEVVASLRFSMERGTYEIREMRPINLDYSMTDSLAAPEEKMAEADPVDHPPHYGGEASTYEAIKVIEAWQLNFALGSAVKYISRHGKKTGEDAVRDLQKAAWYCLREAERLEREGS